ncbi:MAG: U32 family peptidase [Candidatus Pacebacteria bacterium]|nr:U32 family peptidase [Candidatus Paceibacterota bacterium]
MLKCLNNSELIAPAGSFEKLVCAIEYGADAVYAGAADFSLRARINKFDDKKIIKAIEYVHQKNKKIYITANVFAHNNHIELFEKHLKIYKKNMPDAFIVSDIGMIQMIRNLYPNAKIHLSTQANTTNWQSAKYWFDNGLRRIVLARELNINEIKEIHKKVPKLELEYFVHGAMCMAYSGRCLLSSWQTGRNSNLGDCAQNCRWKYQLVEEERPNEYIPIEQDEHGTYLLNSKDLCLIEHLDELRNAGITSFKIEGRAKSVYYLAQVVKAYRTALDIDTNENTATNTIINTAKPSKKPNNKTIASFHAIAWKDAMDENKEKNISVRKLKNELKKLQNRTFTTGFLSGECKFKGQETKFSHIKEEYEFVGEVMGLEYGILNFEFGKLKKESEKNGVHSLECNKSKSKQTDFSCRLKPEPQLLDRPKDLVKIKVHNAVFAGDRVEFIQPKGDNIFCKIKNIYDDKTLEKLKSAHGGQDRMVYIEISKKPEISSVMRKKLGS